MKGAERRIEREHNERAWAVWHIEALRRTKVLPSLKRLVGRKRIPVPQSWQEQQQIALLWARATAKSK